MLKSKRQVRAAVLLYPLRMSQSTLPRPDAEASQSPPAAQRDDSLATNPSAGLVAEDHPPKRRRGGWGLAGVFAVVACLAWLACSTAVFAQTNTISISSVAGNNVVTASEKWNGFKITGHTGNQVAIPVEVTFGTETWNTTSTTLMDGNYWWSVTVEDDETGNPSYITDGDNQTVNAEASFSGGIKLSHSRTFDVDLTLPLVVNAVTGDDVINDGVIQIEGNTGDIGSVRIDLAIGTGSFINSSDLAGEWLQAVSAADNQSYIAGSNALLSVTATKTGYEPSATVSRTLTKDLVHPSVSYTAPLSLQVGMEITPITPTTSDTDIVSYLFSNPLPGLSLHEETGVISGTPTTVNDSTRRSTVIATDAADNDGTATIDFPPVVVAGTLTLNVDDDIAGDDTINIAEKASGFTISGDTGTESGVTVAVTMDGTTLTATSGIPAGETIAEWSVTVGPNENYIMEANVSLSVTATKTNYTSVTVTRTLDVDLTATVSYDTVPSSLEVGEAITAMVPTTNDTDIDSYAISSDSLPLPRGLSLNGTTGVISGTPTTGNPNTETAVLATDKAGNTGTADIQFPAVDGPEAGVTDWRLDPLMPLPVPEGGSAQYTLVLDTEPTHDVTITVNSPVGDEDLTAAPTSLTFTPGNWNAEQTVTVSAVEDADGMAGIRNFSHKVVSPDGIYDDIPAPGVRAVEADNDEIGVTIWPQVLWIPEGGSREYRVVLNTQPTDDVTITVTRDDGGDDDLTAAPTSLTFTPGNWNAEQTVTVSAAADDDQVNAVAVFSHSVSSNDENYQSDDEITIASVEATSGPVTVDETRPRVEIQTEASATVSGAFKMTIRFSEPVDGFELEDIEVSNGKASNFTQISKREYTVTITPRESGAVKVMVKSNAARDAGGNGNRAAEPLIIEADLERPVVAIASAAVGPVAGAFEVTITFNEAVTGFEQSDIQVTNGTVTDFSGSGTSYTAEITPSQSGEVTVEVGAEVAEDAAGDGNRAAEPWIVEVDLERPVVAIASAAVGPVFGAFEVTITFNEAVTGFEQSDIQVTNGTVTDFSGSGTSYTAEITPSQSGEVTVEVGAKVAEDAAGNGNEAAAPFIIATGIAVSYAADSYTATEGGEPVTVTVKLSKAGDEELAIPVRVTRPETTEVGDYQVEGLKGWDAEAGTGTLTYGAGETEQTFTIAANHDGDGDDETVELGIGELPEIVMAGEPAVAIVTLEDKGLVELEVRFGQAAYEVKEGEAAEIKVTVSPAADRRVELPLEVALQDGTTPEDYGGVPVSVVFESGESEGTISVEVLADEVNDPGEGIVLSLGALPEAVSAGDPASTEVHFGQRRTAEQFTSSLEAMLAVMGRSMGESAQTAIEGRFERHRQWSRLGSSSGAVSTPQPGRANRAAVLGAVESERVGSEGRGGRGAEGSLVEHAWGADQAGAATGSDWNSEHRETGTPVSWLRNVVLGSFGNLARAAQSDSAMSTGYGMAPGGRVSGQDRLYGSGFGDARLGLGPEEFTGMRDQETLPDAGTRDTGSAGYSPMLGQALNLSGASLEMSLGEGEEATSWVPVLWGQGDLQQFNGDLTRLGMNYGGGLEAAHLGLDLYANDKVLAGLSFMRSWGDLEYTDDGVAGLLESRMNTVHPYVYWQPSARLSVWGIGGLGQGQVEVEEPGRTHDFGAEFRMFAGGARAVLGGQGSNEWGVRADAFTTQLGTDALEDIAKVRGEAQRGRLMLEWVHDAELSVGRSLSLTAEAGGRIDRGDADRGAGMETGFRLGYLDAHSGLDVALHGRVLVVHESDYRDWGAGVQASWDPGEKQRGFRASVNSSLGQDGGGRTTLWDNADAVMHPAGMGAMGMGSQSRMESEVAYAGLKAPGLPGLLTPYGRLRRAWQGRELALGVAWSLTTGSQLALPATFELETIRRETSTGPADLALLAQMSIPF